MKKANWTLGLLAALAVAGTLSAQADYAALKKAALEKERLIIWDDDGCDMTHYPYQRKDLAKEPASVRNFEQVFLEATEGTKADVISYSGVMGFGYFTALKTGAAVNTNRFAGANEPWRNAVNEFAALGHDAMEMAVAHAHRNGKECFFSLRFNDNHDNGEPDIMLSPFKRQNPEVMVGHERKVKCCGRFAADFAQEKVRAFVKKYIRGYLENYDLDGIEYDFFRHPQLFRTVALGGHATDEELATMTALMKELRAIAEEVGRKRGRPFVLCARVPDSVEYCKAIGIDLERWAQERVIDFLVVGGYFQLEPWRKSADLVHGWGMKCYASLDETRIQGVKGSKLLPGRNSNACWLARIAAAMASGMDGVNLFNIEYFNHADQKYIMGHDIRDLDGVEKLYFATYVGGGGYLPQSFLVGGRDYWKTTGLNPAYAVKLGAGTSHAFDLVVGDDVAVWRKRGKEPVATVKLLSDAARAADVRVTINGTPVAFGEPENGVMTAQTSADLLKKGANAVEIVATAPVTLHDFSLRLGAVARRATGLGPVIYNTDGCDMLDYPVDDPITYDGFVSQRLARDIPGSAITAVGYCPVSSGFGFFTALKVGDTLLNPLPGNDSTWRGRKVYNATGTFAKKGMDALEMGLRYARSMGCATIASIRMNDTHDQSHTPENPYFLFSPFKIRHPEFLMGTKQKRPPHCAWSAVDYTHPEVRQAMLGYVKQMAANYDFEALDLDFFRHVQYFKSVAWGAQSASDAEREMMTDLIRDIRAVLNQTGVKKGRRLFLIVRTPDSAGYCHAAGLDIEQWMKEKLIDVWCGSGYFRLCPWRESVELAHRYGVRFYASLDESRVEGHCARLKLPRFTGRNSRENFAARVAAAAEEGCDGVEFFNIDDYPASERKAIAALAPGKTDGLDKDYFLVNRGSGGYSLEGFLENGIRFRKLPPVEPGRKDTPRLQANVPYSFEMTLSDDFAGRSKSALVTTEVLLQPTLPNGQLPTLTVNGKTLAAPVVPKKDVITFTIPVSALKRGTNAFTVTAPAACEFRDFVLRVRHSGRAPGASSAKLDPNVYPRVWTSLSSVRSPSDFERAAEDLVAHGVQVCEAAPWWSDEIRAAALKTCRAKGLRMHLEIREGSRCDRAKRQNLDREMAVMIGGCYKGLAIDRHLYSFTPEKHRIVIEPPVYSRTQAYLKHPHYMMQGDGHYYGQYVPTGRAEIIVPEKLFDGRQHLKIIPVEVKRAPADAAVENDTVASGKLEKTKDILNRPLVELEFDLTGLEKCRLDKVGIAVYWHMDKENPAFNPMRGCYSLFAPSTREALRKFAEDEVSHWMKVNGGTFPSDVIIAARLGDEVFNHTGWLNSEAVSLPLWGYSESALKVYGKAFKDGETYPRTWGAGEVYGKECVSKFLYVYHQAAARYLRETVDYLHAYGVKSFRNTTRGHCWGYGNDHDGTAQEILARELDYLHLDPYPYTGSYNASTIPGDCAYMKGLSRRYGKPMLVWMQAHFFGPGGLQHPDPETVSRMYGQVKRHSPDSIMWLGYSADPKNTGATYPFSRPDSWERAAVVHADFMKSASHVEERPQLAVLRPYDERAAVADNEADKNSPDRLLFSFVNRWSVNLDRAYDIFEIPPKAFQSKDFEKRLAAKLKSYRFVVSSAEFPGAICVAADRDGRKAERKDVWKLADELSAQLGK